MMNYQNQLPDDEYIDYDEDEADIREHRKEVTQKIIACLVVVFAFGGFLLYVLKPQITLPNINLAHLFPAKPTAEPVDDLEDSIIYSEDQNQFTEYIIANGVYGKLPEGITIPDTIEYKNLVPGETYTIVGKICDKTTGEVIHTQTFQFVADDRNGEVVIEFTP